MCVWFLVFFCVDLFLGVFLVFFFLGGDIFCGKMYVCNSSIYKCDVSGFHCTNFRKTLKTVFNLAAYLKGLFINVYVVVGALTHLGNFATQ